MFHFCTWNPIKFYNDPNLFLCDKTYIESTIHMKTKYFESCSVGNRSKSTKVRRT